MDNTAVIGEHGSITIIRNHLAKCPRHICKKLKWKLFSKKYMRISISKYQRK